MHFKVRLLLPYLIKINDDLVTVTGLIHRHKRYTQVLIINICDCDPYLKTVSLHTEST